MIHRHPTCQPEKTVAQLPFFRRSSRRVQTRSRGCCVAWPRLPRLVGQLRPDRSWQLWMSYLNLLQKPVEYWDIKWYQYDRMFGTPETCLQKDLLQETSSIELQDDFVEYNDWTYLFPRICHILHHLRPNWSVEWIRWCSACQSPPKKHTTSIPCVDTSFLALSGNIPPIH